MNDKNIIMYNINKHTIKNIISQELLMLHSKEFNYHGTKTQIKNMKDIYEYILCTH